MLSMPNLHALTAFMVSPAWRRAFLARRSPELARRPLGLVYSASIMTKFTMPPGTRNTGRSHVSIPAPGTQNNDHNPQRIAPRNLFDLGLGHDNIFHGDKYRWSARVTVVNLANSYVLYNFLSTFSGTHYVSPRTVTGTIGCHF